MITLTAKINLLSGNNGSLWLGSNNTAGNNISNDLNRVVGVKNGGSNPFIIGASKLGDGSTFSRKVDYFIGNQLSDENGDFINPYEFEIKSSSSLSNISIAFDTVNNRYPKTIKLYKKVKQVITENREGRSNGWANEGGFYEVIKDGNNVTLKFSVKGFYDLIYNVPENATFNTAVVDGSFKLIDEEGNPVNYSGTSQIRVDYNGEESISGEFEGTIDESDKEILELEVKSSSFYVTLMYEYEEIISENIVAEYIGDYVDDDPIFTIPNLPFFEQDSSLLIKINDWNSPNYPLVITGIYTEVSIEINRKNLIAINRSIFDRSDLKLPSWGIISNTGNIEFNDIDGEIRDYAEQLLLQSGLSCEIRLNNTLVDGASELIAKMETDQWEYDNDSRIVNVSIKDDLEEWQDINVAEKNYDPRKNEHKPFSWLYEHLWKLTSNRSPYVNDKGETIIGKGNYNMLSIVDLDEDTQAVLNNTYIQYPFLESGSLWQQWTKLCQVCQLHIYKNSDGIVVCRYNGGN